MSKTISAYQTFSASDIQTRASVPSQSNMTVSGSNVLCNNIQVSDVKQALGEGYDGVGTLCTSSNVNIYSAFGPTELYVSGGVITSRIKTPYQLGNFAGYNHLALTPGWYSNSCSNDVWVVYGGTAIFISDVITGEINYHNLTSVHGIALTLWEGATLVGYSIVDVDTLGNISSLEYSMTNVTQEKTYTGKIYLTDNLSQFLESLGNAVCKLPNVNDFTVHTKIYVVTTLNTSGCAGWTLVNAGMNNSNSTVSFNDLYIGNSYTNITVQVRLVKQFDNSVETTIFYQGAYTANTHFGSMSQQVHSSIPIPANGYTAYLEILESE